VIGFAVTGVRVWYRVIFLSGTTFCVAAIAYRGYFEGKVVASVVDWFVFIVLSLPVETIPVLSYRCRECPFDFGDPDAERRFETWVMKVKMHAFDAHGKAPYYLNDMLKPIWSLVSIRCS
jgi:hypothetical protein